VPQAPPALRSAAAELHHNGVLMVGVGYEGPLADKRSWMYFPESSTPFYRVTNFAKYAAANVPEADTARFGSPRPPSPSTGPSSGTDSRSG